MSCRPAHTAGMRVLVVEDHATLAGRIAQGLRQAGMAVDAVHDGRAALEASTKTPYDVIVLDRDLPVVHGDQVCRALAGSGPRILMLTAAAQVDDRVDGLELGADDYHGKPFVFAELVARVRALSRRAPSAPVSASGRAAPARPHALPSPSVLADHARRGHRPRRDPRLDRRRASAAPGAHDHRGRACRLGTQLVGAGRTTRSPRRAPRTGGDLRRDARPPPGRV